MFFLKPRNTRDKSVTRRAALTLAAGAATPAWGAGTAAHPVVHFEIGCRDRARSGKFYADLFGWRIQENGPGSDIDGAGGGIAGHMTALGHEPEHYTMFYVEVEDAKVYLDKAVALGGKVVVPPVKIPTGRFAWFSDIDGNTIGLLEKKV